MSFLKQHNALIRSLSGAIFVAGLGAVSMASHAAVTGAVSVLSDYYARGIDQTGGVTVQGNINYQHASGAYASTYISNVKWFDKTGDGQLDSAYEWDVYLGYANKIGALGYDVGILNIGYPTANKYNTVEFYGGLNTTFDQIAYPTTLSAKVFYSPDRNAYQINPKRDDKDGWYTTAQADIKLKPDLTLTPQVGYAFGETLENKVNGQKVSGLDKFLTYSLTLNKNLKDGFSASFSFVGTDIDGYDKKAIVGLTKSFDF